MLLNFYLNYDRTGTAKQVLAEEAVTEEQRWEMLSTKEKVGDWALRHRWHLFVACWGASMVGSWLVLRRNTTQTFSQKIVQARVYVRTCSKQDSIHGSVLTRDFYRRKELLLLHFLVAPP